MPFEQLKTSGSAPQTGGELPPLDGTLLSVPRKNPKQFVQSLMDRGVWGGGTHGAVQILAYLMGKGGGGKGTSRASKANNKPGSPKTPTTPSQWTFQPSPYDQPNYAVPMGNAAQYTINPPAQQWMFDPATGGQGAPPQWYGQPVVPNSQPPIR